MLTRRARHWRCHSASGLELEDELQEKEARLALLNADLNIDGDSDLDVINDTESRDTTDEYSEDEPDDNYDEDEPDDEEYSGNYRYGNERVAQAVTAKAKPSILDGIRNFDSGKHSGVPGGTKSTERDI